MAAQEPLFAGMGELFKQNHTDGFFYSVLRGGPIVYIVGIIVGIHTDVPKFRLDLGTALTRMMHTIMSISSSVYKVFVGGKFLRFFFSCVHAHLAQVTNN